MSWSACRAKIDQRLALLHGALNADLDTISEIEEPELRCATLHERVNPTDAYSLGWHIRQLQQGQHETFAYLGNLGVGIALERLAAGDFDGYDEVFLLLDGTDDYLGDVETRPAARCLTLSFRGTHGQAVPRYEQLLGYMREHNLTPAGPSREIALIDDIISDDPATYVTQITVPVVPGKVRTARKASCFRAVLQFGYRCAKLGAPDQSPGSARVRPRPAQAHPTARPW